MKPLSLFRVAVRVVLLIAPSAAFAGVNQWTTGGPRVFQVREIVVHPSNPLIVYAATQSGLYVSTNGGGIWSSRNEGLINLDVYSLAIDPQNPTTLYSGPQGTLFKSTDSGASWLPADAGLPETSIGFVFYVRGIAVDPRDSSILYAATNLGLFKSVDGGASWSESDTGIDFGVQSPDTYTVVVSAADSNVVYAGSESGVWKSVDGGVHWARGSGMTGFPGASQVGAIALDPLDPSVVYAGGGSGFFRSDDAGSTWVSRDTGSQFPAISSVVVDPIESGRLYAGTFRGVFSSADRGETWAPFGQELRDHVVSLALDSRRYALHAGTFQGDVFDFQFGGGLTVTLPAVSSLHGLPPTFFHSDVWVFNGSVQGEATVTATYRCAQESCGNAVQSFTIPPRHVRFFPDMVGTLFGAPETFGAVEFDSAELITVTSRLYTPARSEPTAGMFVPGLALSEAHVTSVLASLSHDSFFRTNVGVYNPTDFAQPVLFQFFGASGGFLGEVFGSVGPRRSLQVNDPEIFSRISLPQESSDFYCLVVGDGVHALYAYASVIDRHSQDPIFVPGADGAGALVAKTTLPAVAHVQGVGNTFFKSDVKIWNASAEHFANVTARFACFEGDCGERVFTVAPRQMLAWDDVVASLFQSTSSGGAVEFVSDLPIVVTSRLYTPTLIEATYGMFVPGLPPEASSPAVVLNGLSHPSDFSTGSRVNVGVFNQADVAQVVTYRLFDGSGNVIGQTSRLFAPREFFQANDVFAFLNVSQSVESAYCLVEGSELLPLFVYAAVIDNQSQDPIFIPGEDDPEHPPIVPLSP